MLISPADQDVMKTGTGRITQGNTREHPLLISFNKFRDGRSSMLKLRFEGLVANSPLWKSSGANKDTEGWRIGPV